MKTLTPINWLLAILTLLLLPTSCSQSTDDLLTDGPQPGIPQPDEPLITIHVAKAGTLGYMLDTDASLPASYEIANLKLTGKLNGTDLRYLREMAGSNFYGSQTRETLKFLDLSEAKIVNGGEKYISDHDGYKVDTSRISYYAPNLFYGCKSLVSVKMPEGIVEIPGAFKGCRNLVSVSLPENITDLSSAFENCGSLISVNIPKDIRSLKKAFKGCTSLTSIDIPKTYGSSLESTFQGCTSLTSIIIPAPLQDNILLTINHAFAGCTNLTSATITCRCAGDSPFAGCPNLQYIRLFAPFIQNDTYFPFCSGLNDSVTIYIPQGTLDNYKAWGFEKYNLVEFDTSSYESSLPLEYNNLKSSHHDTTQYDADFVQAVDGITKKILIR